MWHAEHHAPLHRREAWSSKEIRLLPSGRFTTLLYSTHYQMTSSLSTLTECQLGIPTQNCTVWHSFMHARRTVAARLACLIAIPRTRAHAPPCLCIDDVWLMMAAKPSELDHRALLPFSSPGPPPSTTQHPCPCSPRQHTRDQHRFSLFSHQPQ
ncbi:uncharacterized protein B0I36DRAFT_111188 [Microdochium trichocladiopsis]|uniref:Uncharacterized protein n=1 Tax=Microdochium trichocladiopsis TaxID=1682393 RepID=A0A9P8YAA5_9PEZI|nr:uncharacterized protein B0I36DRAFT_111188 [Microdochium trichocladiopsis]KAH7033650.1 hypothetical protein B0I36DRAFT_111188 [Microdochium trichocladiopsis]